jgi:hypothetical protein
VRRVLSRHGWWLLPLGVLLACVVLVLILWSMVSSLHTAATGCAADNGKGGCAPGWAINIALPVAIASVVILSLLAHLGLWKWQGWFRRDE